MWLPVHLGGKCARIALMERQRKAEGLESCVRCHTVRHIVLHEERHWCERAPLLRDVVCDRVPFATEVGGLMARYVGHVRTTLRNAA